MKKMIAIIMAAIAICVMMAGPAKAEELEEDPMYKYEIELMEKFERWLPLVSDGEYTLISQHIESHDDGTYDWTMRAYNHALKQAEVDEVHFDNVFELVIIGASLE